MRLRLRCGTSYSLGDLQWCMVHVPDHVRTIRDLASHVSRLLELNLRGGGAEPPQLMLDGFLVPHDEEVREVLRDDEVVDVEPAVPGGAMPGLAALPPPEQASGGKRSLAVAGLPAAGVGSKRARNGQEPAVMALGWQPREVVLAAPKAKAKAPAVKAKAVAESEESSEEESSEEEAPVQKGKALAEAKKAAAAAAAVASAKARAIALATCGSAADDSQEPATGFGIFVGGLPFAVGDAELKKHFEFYGPVEEATVVMNTHTAKSKGFGFVEFKDAATRDKVIADGTQDMNGKSVEVKPRQSKGSKGGGSLFHPWMG
ncbi:unnamed protein product [Polarella glacialis]|uniref:RRM domain-containing protein n=1 Tax=Polarella glacialis TaxID=89957 RepID=A0A813HPP6_POLGL|nr:unnamed protein product [Polarella glacialis]